MSKFTSRKFWMAVVSALLVVANQGLGMDLDTEVVLAFAGIVMTYIFAEAKIDAEKAKNKEGNNG